MPGPEWEGEEQPFWGVAGEKGGEVSFFDGSWRVFISSSLAFHARI